jgi:hypothetical protein
MSAHRLRSIVAASLCALAGLLALATASASAHLAHPYICQITASSTPSSSECNLVGNVVPGGALGRPNDVAVDGSGQVYVSDGEKKVIDVFDAAGNFTRQLTGTSPSAPFNEPWGLTLDGSNDLWTADVGPGLMDKFSSAGSFLAQGTGEGHWTTGFQTQSVAFSDASNHLYVADSNRDDLWVLNADGTYNSDITGPWGSGCCFIYAAADNSAGPGRGDIYVSSGPRGVFRVDSAGAAAAFSGSASYISGAQLTGTPEGSFGELGGVTVDSAGNLYVLDRERGGAVDEFNSAGVFVARTSGLSTPSGFIGPNGLAVSPTGDLYVTSQGSPATVDVFGPLAELPGVAIEPAASVEAGGARLNGLVNPENAGAATCQFQWGTTTTYGHTAPCSAGVPNGASPVAVSAQLSGLQANTTYHYRLTATNANGLESSADETFTTPGPPLVDGESAEVVPAKKIGQTSATLQAQVTPDKRATTYSFEYGETPAYGSSAPTVPASIGASGSPVSVPATQVSGLKIGTTYHYRVVASNEYGTVDGPDQTFTTLPTLLLDGEGASTVTASSATIEAQLNPLGSDVRYHLEYGLSAAYGSSAPVPDGDAGAGESDTRVYLHLQGLPASTTYHYRLVAVSAPAGKPVTVTGPDQTFTTQATGATLTQPDGRQWEMVSPPNKQGSGIFALGYEQGDDIQASAAGNGITYGADSPFAVNPAGSRSLEVTQVISSRRAPDSWETADITTAHNEPPGGPAIGQSAEYKLFSSDLSLGLVQPVGPEKTLYLREADGSYKALVTPAGVPSGTNFDGEVRFISASPDLSHVIVQSHVALASGEPAEGGLYEWAAGRLQLVSVLPTGEPTTEAYLGDRGFELGGVTRHAISDDGSHIVWEDNAGNYYLRDMTRKETVKVNAAQQGLPETGGTSHYRTANSEGTRVFLTSDRRLTVDSTAESGSEDLYVFEVISGPSEPLAGKLTDLTVDSSVGQSAGVQGVIGASEDGSYVYFVAGGLLGDAAAHRVAGGHYLYMEHYDTGAKVWTAPKLVAALSAEDSPTWGSGETENLTRMTSRVSPNGRYLTFMSDRSLTGYENQDANSDVPDEEVFLYDVSTGRVVCASCDPTGGRPVGLLVGGLFDERLVDYTRELWENRWLAGNVPGWTTKDTASALYQSRYLSDSGRLFFNSADALVPADVNGKADVYEYEPDGVGSCQGPSHGQSASVVFDESVGGCIALISSGTSSEESAFMDASETGGDVFFLTLSQLSPSDYDTSIDLYDAHECTTAAPCAPPAALTPPPCTTGDACKVAPTPQPTLFGAPSSETFSGAGNIAPSVPGSAKPKSKSKSKTQVLAKALKACRKQSRSRRAGCERRAREKYGAKPSRAGKSLSTGTRR